MPAGLMQWKKRKFNFVSILLSILVYFVLVFLRLVLTIYPHKSSCTNTLYPA